MKSSGLSSKVRKAQRHIAKTGVYASIQEGQLAAREQQRHLRVEAAKAQFERSKKAAEAAAAVSSQSTSSS
jgi:hypothetical protein